MQNGVKPGQNGNAICRKPCWAYRTLLALADGLAREARALLRPEFPKLVPSVLDTARLGIPEICPNRKKYGKFQELRQNIDAPVTT